MPEVSVIIPTYRRSGLLAEALNSVLSQTFGDFEVVVVDDFSNDGGETEAIVKSFSESRFKYLCLDSRKGPAGARNAAFPYCEGKYLSFLDSDDLIRPEKLKNQIFILDNNPDVAMVYSDEYILYEHGGMSPEPSRKHRVPPLPSGFIARDFFLDSFIGTMTVTLRKDVFEEAGGFDEELMLNEDDDLWLRIMIGQKVVCSDYPAGVRRLHNGGVSHEGNISRNRDKMVFYQYQCFFKYFATNEDFVRKNTDIFRLRASRIMLGYVKHCLTNFAAPKIRNIRLYYEIVKKIEHIELS
jgi:glycosyltransferase involved in cell wall biosynthesis